MSEAPEKILVTGDDQYRFGCVHGAFPIGRTESYIREDIYEDVVRRYDKQQSLVTDLHLRIKELETRLEEKEFYIFAEDKGDKSDSGN